MSDSSTPRSTKPRSSRRRVQEASSPGRSSQHQPARRQSWAGKSPQDILANYPTGKTPPLKVLEVLIELFNALHTSMAKTVSHKTRQERAQFLRRFFRDLRTKAGFKTVPDPRNLGQKHIRAMVQVWQQEHLAPATIQTYLSFLRGVAIDPVIAQVCDHDSFVGASLRLIRAMGLRRKESVLFRPFESIVPFESTGLPPEDKSADRYARIKGKGGRVRHIPLDSPERLAAVAFAQGVVSSQDAHMGNPAHDLRKNLRHFDYVLTKFGITVRERGVTAHGLRHEVLIGHYEALAGTAPPVRGNGVVAPEVDRAARQAVALLAGHARPRAACAYLGAVQAQPSSGSRDGDDKREAMSKAVS